MKAISSKFWIQGNSSLQAQMQSNEKLDDFRCCLHLELKLIGPAKVHTGSESLLHPFHRSHSHDFDSNSYIQALATCTESM